MSRPRHTTKYPGIRYRLVDETRPQGDRRYIVWYSDSNGDAHTVTMPAGATLEEARLKQGELNNRKANGETLIRARQTVEDLLRQHLEVQSTRLGASAIENYKWIINKRLVPAFGRKRATELTPSDVAGLIRKLQEEGLKTWTIKKILSPLNGAYRVAVRDGVVASNPCEKLLPHERPKADQREMRCLSSQEISALLGATGSPRWKALFSLLAFTGLRISEALGLTWDDVTEDSVIVRSGKTKAAEREVFLIPAVRSLLAAEKLKQAPGTELVFSTQAGSPVGRREALRALRAAEDRAGLPHYTLHELRHTFASILIHQGELPTFVARMMGHADPGITLKVYTHLWEEQESTEAASERLQAAMGGLI